MLSGGDIVEQGRTHEVLTRPRSASAARIAGLNLVPGTACAEGLRTSGRHSGSVHPGEPVVAVFPPAAVAVYRDDRDGSPRNVVQVVLAALEPHGDMVRLRVAPPPGRPAWIDGLAADVTPAAVADLTVEPGHTLWFAVKAAEVTIHPAAR